MAENLLELTTVSYTANQLAIKVKNASGAALDKRLVIEFSPPSYLISDKLNAEATLASKSTDPVGAKSLAGIVTGPQGWSVWVRRETSDSAIFIAFMNDMDEAGVNLPAPTKFEAGGEFTVTIPLDPTANRGGLIDVLYSYQRGDESAIYGKIELKSEQTTWNPDVTLSTKHPNPTMVKPGDLVKIEWKITDGVSAILRGPLPGGNADMSLSTKSEADFKLAAGSIDVRVMSAVTYVLEAEVKRAGQANVQVVRMLSLDTPNTKYLYVDINPQKVLPNGLLEINWAAWGVKEVELNVRNSSGTHTTRSIPLTQQTKGRFFEGNGVMRVSAAKTDSEKAELLAGLQKASADVSVVSWASMVKPDLTGRPLAMAVQAPELAVLTSEGLFMATVGEADPEQSIKKLIFTKVSKETPKQWLSLTTTDLPAKEKRFVVLRRTNQDDLELAPYTLARSPEDIAPLNLPADVRPLVAREATIFDCVGFNGRVYVVIESGLPEAKVRRAFSAAFNGTTKKAEYRPEPLLEPLTGYRLVSFDNALYALNRASGRMFRFGLTTTGTLEAPRAAASAIKEDSPQKESMIRDGVFVPIGRVLAVLGPSSVPSLESLERFGLHNVLGYLGQPAADPNKIPQDLFYNPQKNYWARCGHDLDAKTGAVAAYRPMGSRRLWLIQPNGETHTLAAGSESLFAHDYASGVPTAALPPYLDKTREFTILNDSWVDLAPMSEQYRDMGLIDFAPTGPGELLSQLPQNLNHGKSATFQFRYNEADPAPIRLRFLAARRPKVKHDYFVEVTFSGRDLSTATSVFKRIAEDTQGVLSVAEIPGTTVNYTIDKQLILRPPKILVGGVRLRTQNATTYQLWREPDQGMYQADGTITYTSPPFTIYAHGAGHLQVNVDFSLPSGVEIVSAGAPQRKLISIDTSRSTGLRAEVLSQTADVFDCKITYVGKSDINGVYIGDGVANERGEALYIPLSIPHNQRRTRILKINPENLTATEITHDILYSERGGFAMPNSIAVTNEAVLALFDNQVFLMNTSLQYWNTFPYLNSTISAFQAHSDGDCCMIETNPGAGLGVFSNYTYHFQLLRGRVGKNFRQELDFSMGSPILLDNVRSVNQQPAIPGAPPWVPLSVSPMALSPSPVSTTGERIREVAICISGGVFVVGNNANSIRSLALQSAGREEAVVFGRDGSEIYCAHSQGENEGLRISRIDNKAWKQTHSLSLPRGEGVANLTTDTRQRNPQDRDKVSRS
ncbi:MAG TPA: hypothetical protein VF088_02855, partial [Pyrinomonadaceae bacterium]